MKNPAIAVLDWLDEALIPLWFWCWRPQLPPDAGRIMEQRLDRFVRTVLIFDEAVELGCRTMDDFARAMLSFKQAALRNSSDSSPRLHRICHQ